MMITGQLPVLAAPSVDEKHQILCSGVYDHFSTKYGTQSRREPRRKRKSHQCSKQERARIREERNKARRQLRKAKRNSIDRQSIRHLARNFHLYLRQFSRFTRAERRHNHHLEVGAARKECAKNLWRFARKVLDNSEEREEVQPIGVFLHQHNIAVSLECSNNLPGCLVLPFLKSPSIMVLSPWMRSMR